MEDMVWKDVKQHRQARQGKYYAWTTIRIPQTQ